MRKGTDGQFWIGDDKEIIAVNLGADYCAEHEWGIKGINSRFGISSEKSFLGIKSTKIGIDSRTITKCDSIIEKVELEVPQWSMDKSVKRTKKKLFGIAMKDSWRVNSDYSWLTKSSHWDPTRDSVLGFWAESRFLFLVEDELICDEFVTAFQNKDISIWTGGAGAFKNGGLVIAIVSRIPEDFKKSMTDTDQDRLDLEKAVVNTGIHKILEKAGKKFNALSPRWKDESKKEITFWLNPQDPQDNYGWYALEDLKQWTKGEGPIPKKEKDDR